MDLWQRMQRVANNAQACGHLVSIPNQQQIIQDDGIDFVIRYAPELIAKLRATHSPKREHPFLPPEAELFVEEVSPAHNLILNKYNVLPLHGLITTKTFVEQTQQLSLSDFSAVASVLEQVNGLVFYNGGKQAGASQAHRHFQLVPCDLGGGNIPIDSAIQQWHRHPIGDAFSFRHRLHWLPGYSDTTLQEAWQKLEFAWQPYNLLITRQWMLVVPRKCESFNTMSINSLGFAGALLAKDERELADIVATGPLAVLASTVAG